MKQMNKKEEQNKSIPLYTDAKKRPAVDTSRRFKTKNKKHGAKITKKWNIEDFVTGMLYVQVKCYLHDVDTDNTIEICRPCFEQWLQETGRLDWCMEGFDGNDEYTQSFGSMAIDDYWENAEYDIKLKDLKDYMEAERLVA